MGYVDVTIKLRLDLDDFECKTSSELTEMLEDSEEINLEITNPSGDAYNGVVDFYELNED